MRGKWWLWVVVIPLGAVGLWQAYEYAADWVYYAPFRAEEREQLQILAAWKAEGERLEALDRKDTYGGKTPEETLELFIEALEAGDYELASKYYLPEQQESVYQELSEIDGFDQYLQILKTYDQQGGLFYDGITYEIEFFDNGAQKHLERFKLNEYTKKWKLEDY